MNEVKHRFVKSIVIVCTVLLIPVLAHAELDWMRVATEYTPPRIDDHQIVYDIQNASCVSFGWYSRKDDVPMYQYDGRNWYQILPSGDWPEPRSNFGMAYDSDRDVVVIFGGFRGGFDYLGDTWEWDGTQWEEKFPEHSPSDRIHPSMTYSTTDGVLFYGGYTEDLVRTDEVWMWDGNDWSELTCLSYPEPTRTGSQLAYDLDRDLIVMFGGTDNGSTELDDTWEWDGIQWTEILTPDSPTGKRNHCLVYDSTRQRTVLFGGNDTPYGLSNETWEYDGQNWTRIMTAHHPTKRGSVAGCYDSERQRIVLYGGYTETGSNNETWEYYDVPPSPTPSPTPTPTPVCAISGVTLSMPSQIFSTGDLCGLKAELCLEPHPGEALPFFLILEVANCFFYYPTWRDSVHYQIRSIPLPGETLDVFQEFNWPENTGTGHGVFYGAFTNSEITTLVGDYGIWEFQWSQ